MSIYIFCSENYVLLEKCLVCLKNDSSYNIKVHKDNHDCQLMHTLCRLKFVYGQTVITAIGTIDL